MKTIGKIILTMAVMFAFIVIFAGIVPRKWVIEHFMVDNPQPKDRIQLVAILGGGMNGEKLGASSKERLDTAIAFIRKNNPERVLICEYRQHQGKMYKYLQSKGINKDKFIYPAFSYSDKNSGTKNNMLEIDSVMRKHDNVVVVTSPYHEKRADIIYKTLTADSLDCNVISFLHVDNSEILKAPFKRYLMLMIHEAGAIAVDTIKYLKADFLAVKCEC